MQQEYEKAKVAWSEENSNAKNTFSKLETETVNKKIECADWASKLDTLMLLYDQCIKDLKNYGIDIQPKFISHNGAN